MSHLRSLSMLILLLAILPVLVCDLSIIFAQPPSNEGKGPVDETSVTGDLIVTGILLNADGSPASDKVIAACPLDDKGIPLIITAFVEVKDHPGSVTMEKWNPAAKSDSEGRFLLIIPRVSRIGDSVVTDFILTLSEPPRGWQTVTVSELHFADGKKQSEKCGVRQADYFKLLRQGGDILRIKTDTKAGSVDLGKIII